MLRIKFLTIAILTSLITLTSCSTTTQDEEVAIYETVSVSTIEEEVLDLVNEYRASQGLNVVEFGNVAYSFAESHNEYMIEQGVISHDNFNVRSSNLTVEAKANFVSENVGKDFVTAQGVVNAWINSPTHKRVMEGDFNYTAISVKEDSNGVLYFTQLFYK
ncbi:CAP domain-containing protein [Cellulophaga sp. HaHaR_3_176]|uniref:CAP domain-containing protein n=1 Tax=Cellulophaga sp. HaHaR_3_176 TaxID=1942464 RepID=UPI001C1F6E03|nr:CAP domain-containing protein [Cellulophaga sp. HaHaR_3_176]QWX84816.1 CAP domain-containing protein [Cellulophaga sp. HaHaR_3_176]